MLVDIASHQLEHDGAGQKVTFALMQDVTERDRLHEQLVHQANHDILTGLPTGHCSKIVWGRLSPMPAVTAKRQLSFAWIWIALSKSMTRMAMRSAISACRRSARRLSTRVRAVDTVARTGRRGIHGPPASDCQIRRCRARCGGHTPRVERAIPS